MQRIKLKREPRLDVRHEAYSFQSDAVGAIRDLEYSAVFHEQGLGKSKIVIDLMLYWLEKRMVDTVLFVAKKSLIHNWEKEFERHTHIKPRVLSQNRMANYYAFNSPARVMLTHYEVLRSEEERFKLFLKSRNVAAILDESTKIKNPDSTLSKSFFELAPLFTKRVIVTGTPVANRPYDIWAQVWFLDQGKSLGEEFSEFKRTADLTNELHRDSDARQRLEACLDSIFGKISAFSVRQTKGSGVIELPEKEIRTEWTTWEDRQYDLYTQFQEEMRAIVVRDGVPTEDRADEILKRLLRLVQIASNPRLVDQSYSAVPGKLEVLEGLVSDIVSRGEKCIVWSTFTENVDWLCREFLRFGAVKVHGKMSMDVRNRAVDMFLADEETRVFVATPGAAKEGLTLTAANHVIYYDRGFSLDDYLQSQDRIHRISQTRKCFVHKLIMKDSIDEWVDILLETKHLAAQLSQGDISLDYYRTQISYDFGEMVKGILRVE